MSNEKNCCEDKNALNPVVAADIRSLETVLAKYRSIRTENNLKLDDLIKNNVVLKTNLDLVREASLRTKDLDNKEDIESHIKAKEALLLWCLIYCEKVALKHYSNNKKGKEDIYYGTKLGVYVCFKQIRKALNGIFDDSNEKKRHFELGESSVRAYMYNLVEKKIKTEFAKKYKDLVEIKIPEDKLQKADIIEDYAKKGITVFEGKDGKLYYNRYVAGTFTNKESGESFDNPEVLVDIIDTIESEAQKLMDKYTIIQEIRKVIAYMVESGEIDDLEEEFIRDVLCGDTKAAEKDREWKNRGININQTIGNYQRSILTKMQKVMWRKKEWAELADLVQRRKK